MKYVLTFALVLLLIIIIIIILLGVLLPLYGIFMLVLNCDYCMLPEPGSFYLGGSNFPGILTTPPSI